ncbi:hypothetical protein SpCBS45565_g06714 [Spizellomyces sp. 'palustris']|nr:hypothetical protein SpCBS45565_g06714 [Spizellomyces sp. 'palustris']
MSLLQSLKSRLPSRNWCIFLGTTSTITGLAIYDKYHLRNVRKELDQKAAILANEPMQTWEVPRKVKVYVAPTHWARYWFKQYIKPVFDSAALDYEVVEPKVGGQIHHSVRDLIWAGKDEQRALPPGYRYEPNQYSALGNPLERPKYSADEGLIAVGPNAWREVLRGLKEGALAERPPPAAVTPVETTPNADSQNTDTPSDTPNDEATATPEPPLDLSEHNLPSFPLPQLGYITGRNQSGWTGFPRRVYGWFTERETAREIGEEALKVAFGRVREFDVDRDPILGSKDVYVNKEWSEEQKKSAESVEIPRTVGEKLYIYN